MKTIIVNGANGYVASNFINSLLNEKYNIIALVRGSKKRSAEERMNNVLADLNDNEEVNMSNLRVYDYSLLENNFGLDKDTLNQIFSGNVDYFHFAASLKYDEKSVDEIFPTNVQGVENSIEVFLKYTTKNSRFFYVGTAYSCGKLKGVFEEKFYENSEIASFRNYYEQSKRFAENIVRKNIRKKGLNGHIIRLSQVVGNHKTGITKTDYGIFDFAKRVYNLAYRFPGEVVRVHVDPHSTQNLIPIDTVTAHLNKVVHEKEVPAIMNFVSKNSIKNEHIIEILNQLTPINLLPVQAIERNEMSSIERLMSVGMSFTESYTETSLSFDTQQRDRFVGNQETGPSAYSVARMLEYFIGTLSEKRKKQESVAA